MRASPFCVRRAYHVFRFLRVTVFLLKMLLAARRAPRLLQRVPALLGSTNNWFPRSEKPRLRTSDHVYAAPLPPPPPSLSLLTSVWINFVTNDGKPHRCAAWPDEVLHHVAQMYNIPDFYRKRPPE